MPGTICYWRGNAEVHEDLVHALGEQGYEVNVVRGLEDLLTFLERYDVEAILVDGSGSQREASERVVEISSTEPLQNYPIIFVAPGAAKRLSVLKGQSRLLVPLEIPYRLPAVMHGMSLLLDGSEEIDLREIVAAMNGQESAETEILQSEEVLPLLSAAEKTERAEEVQGKLSEAIPTLRSSFRAIEGNSIQNRERLKANLNPGKLSNTFGGEVFSIASHAEDFADEFLFPDRGKRELYASAFAAFEEQNPWAGVHARRVAFVASALADTLDLSVEKQENVRLVSLFMNWANPEGVAIDTKRQELIRSEKDNVEAVANAFRLSAAMIRERFSDERSARTAELVARLLVGQDALSEQDKELIVEAECVMVVELSDRSCWSSGIWNPYGAYRVFQHLRSQAERLMSRPVRCAMIRILGEAVTVHVTVASVFLSNDDIHVDASPHSSVRSATTSFTRPNTQLGKSTRMTTVPISGLEPGMIVARPLKAMDGRVVLEQATLLDEELVFRLWQLASIRALESPVDVHIAA